MNLFTSKKSEDMSSKLSSWTPEPETPRVATPTTTTSSRGESARIPDGTEVRLSALFSTRDIRIDGRVYGDIVCSGKVTIGKTGVVIGDIFSDNVDIFGTMEGNVVAGEILSLMNTCNLRGLIRIQKLCVENGAHFEGNCQIISREEYDGLASDYQAALDQKFPRVLLASEKAAAEKAAAAPAPKPEPAPAPKPEPAPAKPAYVEPEPEEDPVELDDDNRFFYSDRG